MTRSTHLDWFLERRFRDSCLNVGRYVGEDWAFSASRLMYASVGDLPRPGLALRHVFSATGSSVSSAAQITP
ncbi:hypothetical protein D3C85_1885370 [compost metagenome]